MSTLYQTQNGRSIEAVNSPSKVCNLLWVISTFPESNESFRQPIPERTMENMLTISEQNFGIDVKLWVDYKCMTQDQKEWLEKSTEGTNLSLNDLCAISAYSQHGLFGKLSNSPSWKTDKHSLLWRQVDTARLLVSLQGDYDQSFYSDADITNLRIDSSEVQDIISKYGVLLGGGLIMVMSGMKINYLDLTEIGKGCLICFIWKL